jgi:hypothetical protein
MLRLSVMETMRVRVIQIAQSATRIVIRKEVAPMKAFLAMIVAAAILFVAGAQAFAGDEGRVSDEPAELAPYTQAQ